MLHRRWLIPAVFLLATGALLIVILSTGGEQIAKDAASVDAQHPWQGGELGLKKGNRYNLVVEPETMCKGCESDVRVELLGTSGTVMQLDAEFEAKSERVESAFVSVDFNVPQSDTYQLRFEMISSNSAGERLRWKVTQEPVLPLAGWPLGVGALLFLTITAWTWASSDSELLELIAGLGAGSRLHVHGMDATVEQVTEYREEGWEPGVELELRMDDGSRRYLAVERFEDYYEDPSGYEHSSIHHVLLISMPLDPQSLAGLNAQGQQPLVQAQGINWALDANNSGELRAVIYKVGSVFQSVIDAYVYSEHQMPFPSDPGDQWLELVDYRDGDTEWVLMQIIDPGDVSIVEVVERASVGDERLHELQQMAASAKAARARRDARAQQPFGQPQQQQENQFQQQPHGWGDENG